MKKETLDEKATKIWKESKGKAFMTNCILEVITEEYIKSHTVKGHYFGKQDYLIKWDLLNKANRGMTYK